MGSSAPNPFSSSTIDSTTRNQAAGGQLSVLSYHCDGVGSARWIVFRSDAAKHVDEVAHNITASATILVEHFWEHVAASDLELLHESFGEGEYPQDGWGFLEVEALVNRIPTLAKDEFERSGSPWVHGTRWCHLVGCLNDEFPDNSGVWVEIEGPIRESLAQLLKQEAAEYSTTDGLDDPMARWLGRLAIVSQWQWNPPIEPSQRRALHRVIEEFNERNELR